MYDTVSYHIMELLSRNGVQHVFFVPGGGNMFLVDAAGRHPNIQTIATHHEQAAVIAAEAYSRMTNNFGVALVTTGPGGTNGVTGIAGAWLDSIPLLIISGQVKLDDINFDNSLRQKGPQEISIVDISKPITKQAILLKDSDKFLEKLSDLIQVAISERPGPVLFDVPLDIQSKKLNITHNKVKIQKKVSSKINDDKFHLFFERLKKSKKPLFLLGHGVKNSNSTKNLKRFIFENDIPVSLTWPMADFIEDKHFLNTGRPGVVATRSANFIIQKADFIVSLGSRLDRIVTAFNPENFGRNASFFYALDIDKNELKKLPHRFIKINDDIKNFVDFIENNKIYLNKDVTKNWIDTISEIKSNYSQLKISNNEKKLTSYEAVNSLSNLLPENTTIVTGSSGLCIEVFYTHFRNKKRQKIFLTTGLGAMGYGLPALVGTCATTKDKVYLFESDGSLMMNLQELQTIKTNKFNPTIFIMNNNGYASIRSTQNNYFEGRLVGTGSSSGLDVPNLEKIADSFGYNYICIKNKEDLEFKLSDAIKTNKLTLCEIMLKNDEILFPKCSVIQTKDNKLISAPIEDMSPLIDLKELKKIMGDDIDPISEELRK